MNRYTIQLVTDAVSEPCTVAEAKTQARVYITNDDAYIGALIPSVRKAVENEINRPLGVQTFELGLPNWFGLPNFYGYGALLSAWPAAMQQMGYGRALEDYLGPTAIFFPRPPLVEIRSMKYTRASDMQVVTLMDLDASPPITSDLFFTEPAHEPGFIMLVPNKTWPTDALAPGFPVKIRFKAGYVHVPEPLKQAVLMTVAYHYENRESVDASDSRVQAVELPRAFAWLCDGYRFEEYK